MVIQRNRVIKAEDEVELENGGEQVVDEAAEMLFQGEDVAELLAEVTGAPVDMEVDGESVIFTVEDEEFVIEPEEGLEVVESKTVVSSKKKPVEAATKKRRGTVSASTKAGKVIRKLPRTK